MVQLKLLRNKTSPGTRQNTQLHILIIICDNYIENLSNTFKRIPITLKPSILGKNRKIKQPVTINESTSSTPLTYTVQDLSNCQANLNMATATIADIRNFIDAVPEYSGEIKSLPRFIKEADNFYTVMNSLNLTQIQKTYCFSMLQKKFIDKAKDILDTQEFTSWDDIKLYLQNNFEDKSTYNTLLLTTLKITQIDNNINDTLKKFKELYQRMTSKIQRLQYEPYGKRCLIIETQKTVVSHFISLLPTNFRASFISKNPQTLDACEQLLINEYNSLQLHRSPMTRIPPQKPQKYFNHPPQKFPSQQFPSRPFNPQDSRPSGPQTFARQNIRNGIETRREFRPTPMSGMTKTTIPMSTQTIKQNYALETDNDAEINNDEKEKESYDEEETFETQSFLEYDPEQIEEST